MKRAILTFVLCALVVCGGLMTVIPASAIVAEKAEISAGDAGPSEAAWAQAQEYSMSTLTQDGDDPTAGAAGSLKVLTAGSNFYIRTEILDPTSYKGTDGVYIKITPQLGDKAYEARGNYDKWLAPLVSSLGDPVQMEQETTAESVGGAGVYTMVIGFDLGEAYVPGYGVQITVKHRDSQSEEQAWADADYYHTIGYSGLITFKYEITDLAKAPTESDWEAADSFDLLQNDPATTGAAANVKFFTLGSNFYFRLTVSDPTMYYNADGIYIHFGTEDDARMYKGRGNYDSWLATVKNDYNEPVLFEQSASTTEAGASGTYVMTYAKFMDEDCLPGKNIVVDIRHRDSQSAGQGWADADYPHTVSFKATLTVGLPADTTVRPEEASDGFTAAVESISYNKVTLAWDKFSDDAEIYKIFVYTVNEEGADEPYDYVAVEGPIYPGAGNKISELIMGLSASTNYAMQVIAYTNNESMLGASDLVIFETISRQESEDAAAADAVRLLIDALPGEITAADEDAIEAARAAYDALTSTQQTLISTQTLQKLVGAEDALAALGEQKRGCSGTGGGVLGTMLVLAFAALGKKFFD